MPIYIYIYIDCFIRVFIHTSSNQYSVDLIALLGCYFMQYIDIL